MRKKSEGLPREREYELIHLAKAGDKKAMRLLIDTHTPFIAKTIKEFTLPGWVPAEDVMQEGKIGMIDAVHRFDTSRGFRLCTFAYWRIKKAIVAYLSEMGYSIKVPFPDVVNIKKIVNRLEAGTSPDVAADQKALQLSKNIHILSIVLGCLPIGPTEAQNEHGDIQHTQAESQLSGRTDMSEAVIGDIVCDEIIGKLAELNVYEGYMLAQYLGFYVTDKPTPLKYIAGEKGKVVRDDGENSIISPGWNGFGLQIGETYNTVSKLIRQSEARFMDVLRKYFDGLYGDYFEENV